MRSMPLLLDDPEEIGPGEILRRLIEEDGQRVGQGVSGSFFVTAMAARSLPRDSFTGERPSL